MRRRPSEPPRVQEYIAPAELPMELILRHSDGNEIRLGVSASLRDLEVIASAALKYADNYVNVERPYHQVVIRRRRAQRLGQSLWDAAVERCGIETPG